MNRFSRFSVDELHTLAAALKESIIKIEVKISSRLDSVSEYGKLCVADADTLLEELMEAFAMLGSDDPSCCGVAEDGDSLEQRRNSVLSRVLS